ncbi:hypothetical protein [Synechococcus sp. CBW1006]|uniref:hypothetical protein n=1 Tax=Synechococcus sp. CBW1006 TaxID=1353138 RepID=UPI0018CEA89A|nr:hypothetical protein [Synechococcus sp. CBW1006]QPN65906.1 hypothetical protein H8F26_13680 [Synechococcus sp. CBW1006]
MSHVQDLRSVASVSVSTRSAFADYENVNAMLSRLIHHLPLRLEKRQAWIDRLIPRSFGQLGEDAVIDNHLGWLGLPAHQPGFYLDIGAHHPTSGSNTFRFYRRGSRGIAVDIGDRKQQLWRRVRPRDCFINAAVVPDTWPDPTVTFNLNAGYGSGTDHVSGYGVIHAQAEAHPVIVPALRAGNLAADVIAWEGGRWAAARAY